MAKFDSEERMKVALVGGETMLGKEIAEVLENRAPGTTLVSFAANGEGNFGEADGEAVYIEPLEPRTIQGTRAVLLAGSPDGARKAYETSQASGGQPVIIDCTGHLEHQPEARILAPLLSDFELGQSWVLVVAHPAASALAITLVRLGRYKKIRQAIAHVFEPASELGKRGITELQQQTTSLLSFKPLDKQVFDAQLSFNLLSQLGEEAVVKLSAVEGRIERDVAAILSGDRTARAIPLPSVRVIAAPVFHGYSISLWVEFEGGIDAQEIGEALASAQVEVRGRNEEPPNNVDAANQSGLIAGDIRLDRNNPHASWLWMAADNLRLTADAAADILNKLGRSRSENA